jgi:hypothetical protein
MRRGLVVKGVSIAVASAIGLLALGHRATSPFAVIRAANVVTLTQLPPNDYPSPIGLDWLSPSNQLLISTYWNTGVPHNFETVDRDTGTHSAWGAQSGWTDEIYFASVRSGQPGGWVEGDVFSAKGSVDVTHIAKFDQNGTLVTGSFATLPAETELKRGGVTFDRYGVPGLDGALVVIASNDVGKGVMPNVWKIDSSGSATKLATLDEHAEGVAVIPNDPQYGPWAGKILYGQEGSGSLGTIDPVTLTVTKLAIGRQVEDIWVIPPNSDFYGVDHLEGGDPSTFGKVWTAPASQWTNLVGKVLLAQEHGAHLWTAEWNGTSFVFDEVNDGSLGPSQNGHQWEHITFAPASGAADANIQLTPATATNRVGDPHVLTAHVNVDSGSGFANAPANTTINIAIVSGPGTLSAPSCQTVGTTGSCTVTLTSTSTGGTTIHASTDVTVGGTPLHRETGDSHTGDSADAKKTWVNAKISIVPDATNEVGQSHTFTATLMKDVGDGNGYVAAAGETLTIALTPSNGATPSPAGPFVLTTNGSGQASATFSSPSAGLVTGHATSTLSVNGSAPFTIATDSVAPNSGDAVKTYVDANIQITPDGTNRVGATHTFTAHVAINTGSGFSNAPDGTAISFTIDSGPGSFTTTSPCTTTGGTGSCTIGLTSA